jgi:hypothetical protein
MRSMKRMMVGTFAASAALVAITAGPAAATTADQGAQARPSNVQATCARGYFCAYPGINFTGTPINMVNCVDRSIPWVAHGSWINNQTGGARAQFKSSDGVVRWTSDAPYTDDRDADWSWVYQVRPC